MYRAPSRRKIQKEVQKPNLIPILDAVFIFIFFLLMSSRFLNINEIPSDVPIVSDRQPPKSNKKPLALTLQILNTRIQILTGVPGYVRKTIGKNAEGDYDLQALRDYLIDLKQKNVDENTVVLEPKVDLSYEDIVKIMDTVRDLKKTDPDIWTKTKDGMDLRVKELFNNIVFGNIQS
ncbi:biopolymer transporter ExbD [Halobacteriovorax marinus]|uniref:Membrane protein n=1 Tax=Halobacteriovorax marinus (strain ATCC BAA-682 / DSM 15412 / SJ) TaxID=862908 RepID=E1X3A5_HALMS|nr:biopolymer transporter ExbD [Halobacteriovorax marinus]ATH06630.1 biopolymer transporter ExbD [Halobacteriovorax marinus]CBW25200.1 putative membrane protein [Halobacteriovorax marinus SJ]